MNGLRVGLVGPLPPPSGALPYMRVAFTTSVFHLLVVCLIV